jgi:hypothetical protein
MASLFKLLPLLMYLFIAGDLVTGCVSYTLIKGTDGRSIPPIYEQCQEGKTTLQEALETLGGPDQVAELGGKDVLIYRRALFAQHGLSFGLPLTDIWMPGFDISAHGRLVRYDSLLLFFTPDGMLAKMVIEEGSQHPFLETILSDTL